MNKALNVQYTKNGLFVYFIEKDDEFYTYCVENRVLYFNVFRNEFSSSREFYTLEGENDCDLGVDGLNIISKRNF